MNLIQALEAVNKNGRKVVGIEFVLEALRGSYNRFEVLDGKNIVPIKEITQKALYAVKWKGGD